jgi:hypothetical protein
MNQAASPTLFRDYCRRRKIGCESERQAVGFLKRYIPGRPPGELWTLYLETVSQEEPSNRRTQTSAQVTNCE